MLQGFLSGALLGATTLMHCAVMCGPLAGATCSPSRSAGALVRYQFGRTLSYGFVGALCGHLGRTLQWMVPGPLSSVGFGALAAVACLAVARTLLRSPSNAEPLVQLTAAPHRSSRLARFARLVPRDPALVGLLSVLLPCGVLAAALLAAVTTASSTLGASLMLGFVSASGVGVLGVGGLARALPRGASARTRRCAAVALVLVACFSIARPIRALALGTDPHGGATAPMQCH